MKSPQERYQYDPQFHALVDMLAAFIHKADFTPSEVREAAMLACIKIEMENLHYRHVIPKEAETAMQVLERFCHGGKGK